jgi:hypothetical protein
LHVNIRFRAQVNEFGRLKLHRRESQTKILAQKWEAKIFPRMISPLMILSLLLHLFALVFLPFGPSAWDFLLCAPLRISASLRFSFAFSGLCVFALNFYFALSIAALTAVIATIGSVNCFV